MIPLLLIVEALAGMISGDQFIERWKFGKSKLAFLPGQKIMLKKRIAVGTVCERHIQHLCVGHSLLQTIGHRVIVVFGFDNGDGIIDVNIKDIVAFLGFSRNTKLPLRLILPSVILVSIVMWSRLHLPVIAGVIN